MVRPALSPPVLWLASLFAGVMPGVGCTGPLSVENRACPCSSGYVCCEAGNICLPAGQICAGVYVTSSGLSVRQGDTLTVQLAGTDLVDVGQVMLGELPVASPPWLSDNKVVRGLSLAIAIPHGTPPGDRPLSLTTHGGAKAYPAVATINVSPIAVGAKGDDAGAGTTDKPFRTLEHAFAATAAGDTVQINGDVKVIGPSVDGEVLIIPNGITLLGQLKPTGDPEPGDMRPATSLMGRLQIQQQAIIRNLTLATQVFVPNSASSLTLDNVQSVEGREVGALVDQWATGSSIEVTGPYSRLVSTYAPPLDIRADGATLRIGGGASIVNRSDDKEAVWLNSRDASVEIEDASLSTGGPNVVMSFQRSNFRVRRSTFLGYVNFMGPDIEANIDQCQFFISTGTSAIGGVIFDGAHLAISNSTFHQVGLLMQAPSDAEVVVRTTKFDGYHIPPISLMGGKLDLGTMIDPGANDFQSGGFLDSNLPPVAIDVPAPSGKGAVSISHSMVGGVMPRPDSVMGPALSAPFYRIANMVPIDLY